MQISTAVKRSSIALLVALALALTTGSAVFAHCQVPCGIYDDPARVSALKEDAATIAKSVKEATALAGKSDVQSLNQFTRWVTTKEDHASHIIDVMANYFLAQRVKPGDDAKAYADSLMEHHAVILAAMKCKQQANDEAVAALNVALDKLAKRYPGHSH